ncbi:MAG: glucose 1-dehydrogenase [Sphingomonadales bacterium]|nr:glucose 1-dehydrogenase [Sphingomonadales bacterium]
MLLRDKVALVTGSGRGLGRACARVFAREGAAVVVVDLNEADGAETVRLITEAGGQAAFIRADVGKSADIQAMVQFARDRFGGLDCAVNNAVANIGRTPLHEISLEDWNRAAAVNMTGVFLCMKYEIRAMLERGGGAIVNIGSGNEHSAMPGLSWYLGAKQHAYGLTKCAALDYGAQGIRVNAVGPGSMWTPALRQTATEIPHHVETLAARSPLKRLAEPEEVAEAAVWLCTPRASYVTGHTLVADGGAVLG